MRGASGECVLVVDDDTSIRDSFELHLGRLGYDVRTAASGEEALAMLAELEPGLVITDVKMAGLDGHQILERLKASAQTRDIPVIMMSAFDEAASVVLGIKRGAEDYLAKPFDLELLEAKIDACLARKRVRDREDLKREIAAAQRAAQRHELGAPTAFKPAELFAGRYEVLRTVGTGGMGVVYKAHDRELGEDVAIKMLHPDLLKGDGTAIRRLKAETRLARRISHRNVVRTHDFGEWQGACYVTMEFVEGMTVRQLIETRGPLGVSAALAIATQLADALEVAHQQGVIHRDIKPQNLLLDVAGVLKVMDFGVARLVEHTAMLTQAGMVVGTPAYMSPEQLLAEAVDGRSDLYSAGVVLYECLTGRLPFEAKSPISLIAKVLHDEPAPPATLNADIPPALSALILRLLGKRPEDRPHSAGDLARLLAQLG